QAGPVGRVLQLRIFPEGSRMSSKGSLLFLLHAHLPYVNHPEQEDFLEENWFFEGVVETYIPLISVLDRLVRDGIRPGIAISISPTLGAMLENEQLERKLKRYIDARLELIDKELIRTESDPVLSKTVRLYALRDFVITSGAGEKLVSATSSWMILDRTSGRPQRFDRKSDSFPWQLGRDEIETNLDKVEELKGGIELARFSVLFSDIDVNRHVNSARYLQWMMDSHSYKHLSSTEAGSIELSFLSEALQNDEVTVLSGESGDRELCSARRTADGKELCRARFEWHRSQ
ncbi:MAG: hypothetical protein WCQ90_13290, partial [Deltaproteobacteria bacterium]